MADTKGGASIDADGKIIGGFMPTRKPGVPPRVLTEEEIQGNKEDKANEIARANAQNEKSYQSKLNLYRQGIPMGKAEGMFKFEPRPEETQRVGRQEDTGMKKGGAVKSASRRADGIAIRGKTLA